MTTAMDVTRMTVICAFETLVPDLGVAALVGETQVAIFRLADDSVFAVQNLDPFSGASVMSRGITGTRGGVSTIASPIYKQVFSLETGECLVTMDKEPVVALAPHLQTFQVTVHDGMVLLGGRISG